MQGDEEHTVVLLENVLQGRRVKVVRSWEWVAGAYMAKLQVGTARP